VFSSGSVKAQRLRYANTQWGDLTLYCKTPYFEGVSDTRRKCDAMSQAES